MTTPEWAYNEVTYAGNQWIDARDPGLEDGEAFFRIIDAVAAKRGLDWILKDQARVWTDKYPQKTGVHGYALWAAFAACQWARPPRLPIDDLGGRITAGATLFNTRGHRAGELTVLALTGSMLVFCPVSKPFLWTYFKTLPKN